MTATTIAPAPVHTDSAQLLTTKQVCDLLQVHRSTLYQWWARGEGPVRMRLPNGSARVRRIDLEEFLLRMEVAA